MEIILIRAAQLILCLSLLVVLHEGGHFFFAKLFGIRVEKFYMFFNPKFHLFSTYSKWWRKLRGKKPLVKDENGNYPYDGTEYGIGWVPLGGYVKIAGMIDESMDVEQMKKPAQPWEFRTKPAWQRLLVMLGGVTVNFLVALFIYSMILFVWGEKYIPLKDMTMGFTFNKEAHALGFKDGDIPIATESETFRDFNTDVVRSISTAKQVTVMRNGSATTINMPEEGLNLLEMFQSEKPFLSLYLPSVIDSVIAGTSAQKADIAKGDRITSFNGKPIETWSDYNAAVANLSKRLEGATTNDSLRKRNVCITLVKANGTNDTVRLLLDSELRMGVIQASALNYYKPVTQHYSLLQSIPAGISHGINVFSGYVSDLKYIFTKEGAKSVGSFGAIGSMFPTSWNWQRFWELTAFISIILAFMNILPIPALDGGHAMFLLIEMIFRRKFSLKFQERAQTIGMFLLILLMIYALGNDIFRFLL
ncbi:MAG: RIP metalloprotease RseP [Bacteroidaceae bacterium]